MQKIYFNVQWLSKSHPAYVENGREWRIENGVNRHETVVDPSLEKSREAEAFARAFLQESIELSDKTILSYLKRNPRGQLIRFYKEIDAVQLIDKDTVAIFEVKHSNRNSAFKKGHNQLTQNAEILSALYKNVLKFLVIVEPELIEDEVDVKSRSRHDFETEDSSFVLINLPTQRVSEDKVALIWLYPEYKSAICCLSSSD